MCVVARCLRVSSYMRTCAGLCGWVFICVRVRDPPLPPPLHPDPTHSSCCVLCVVCGAVFGVCCVLSVLCVLCECCVCVGNPNYNGSAACCCFA